MLMGALFNVDGSINMLIGIAILRLRNFADDRNAKNVLIVNINTNDMLIMIAY